MTPAVPDPCGRQTVSGSYGICTTSTCWSTICIAWTLVGQAGQGARDHEILEVVSACEGQIATQIKFLKTRMKQAAPQALLVAT